MADPADVTQSDSAIWEERLLRAAELGATRALHRIGLNDDEAGKDVTELRGLLGAWRATKMEVWRTIARSATVVVLGVIAALIGVKVGVLPWTK